ncbi:AAA family ATPase [Luedemannella helvata]|uniref:AAA family ATPase n=1 Tax=Luedemannella helvata TaxID=349315 RepID=UPI0031DAC26B
MTWGIALATDDPAHRPARLAGRTDVLLAIEARLGSGGGVVLTGPSGIGKTAILDAVADAAHERGELVLRVAGAPTERWVPFSALADLLAQLPHATLPEPLRDLAAAGADPPDLRLRQAWHELLGAYGRRGNVLLLIDDAQWIDAASAQVIGYSARRTSNPRIRAVVAQRWPESAGERAAPPHPRAGNLTPPPVTELTVPPLRADDLAELLAAHGLPYRAAGRLYADSGGNPYLALALAGAFVDRGGAWRPAPLPERVRALLRERIYGLPLGVRDTLLVASLATRPTVAQLRLAGRRDAERDIRLAAQAGLVTMDGGLVRFTPSVVATVVADTASLHRRAGIHHRLASVATDPVEATRHRALAGDFPDADAARSLVAAAEAALARGARGLVADLYLLAADRTPPELHRQRLDWLVAAAEAAAATSRPELAARAADALLADADAPRGHRVRARMAVIDLAGQALSAMDETFAAALADAGDDPALLAPLRLRLAWQAMVEGARERGAGEAAEAITLAERAGDTATAAMAGAVLAQMERVLGRPQYADTLKRALALPDPPITGWLHLTPRYVAARFAFFDDELEAARAELLRMLTVVEPGGGEELFEVLRSLADVTTRAGRCREALDFAHRAEAVAEDCGLSPGPSWYTVAMAELAGGSLTRALAYARRGVRASEEEHDAIYLTRNLHAVGQARLRTGDVRGAAAALRRLRDLQHAQRISDPSVVRWHDDFVTALASLGAHEEAAAALTAARAAADRLGRGAGTRARHGRAAADLLAERGEHDRAVGLLQDTAARFTELGQPIEYGHSLLIAAQVERRRRRYASARSLAERALATFTAVGATPWIAQATRAAAPDPAELTATEARIAALVRAGASNREIAAQLFLSIKTVEATLTRVYRKLGVRSRTQLSSRLVQGL